MSKGRSRFNTALRSLSVKPMGKVARKALRQRMMDLNQTGRLLARKSQAIEVAEAKATLEQESRAKRQQLKDMVERCEIALPFTPEEIDRLFDSEVELYLNKGQAPTAAQTLATLTPDQLAQLERDYTPHPPQEPVAE